MYTIYFEKMQTVTESLYNAICMCYRYGTGAMCYDCYGNEVCRV